MTLRAASRRGASGPCRTIPSKGRRKARRWRRRSRPGTRIRRWDIGGGGTAWDTIVYDPQFDQVIFGVGNGTPYPMSARSPAGGDNLYLECLVALDAKTGELKWYFQETPKDQADYDAVQPMVLTTIAVNGEDRPVLLHSPKNGFMFVVDRETGKPLAANALVRTSWADGWDLEKGPNLTPEGSDYSHGPKIVFPATPGARNWYPAAYDPKRQSYFVHVLDMGNLMFTTGPAGPVKRDPKFMNAGAAIIFSPDLQAAAPGLPPPVRAAMEKTEQWQWVKDKPYSSELRAIDPMTGKTKWAVPAAGWQDRFGTLATAAGLVFHGTVGGQFFARDADSGKALWQVDTGTSIMAAPMTYRVNGVQYIAVQAGWGGGGWSFVPGYSAAYQRGNANRILVFKVGGGPVTVPAAAAPDRTRACPAGAGARRHAGHAGAGAGAVHRQLRAVPFEPAALRRAGSEADGGEHPRPVRQHRAQGPARAERHAALGRPAQCRAGQGDPRLPHQPAGPAARQGNGAEEGGQAARTRRA